MAKGKWGAVEGAELQHFWKGTLKTGYTPACDFIVSIDRLENKSSAPKDPVCFSIAIAEDEARAANRKK